MVVRMRTTVRIAECMLPLHHLLFVISRTIVIITTMVAITTTVEQEAIITAVDIAEGIGGKTKSVW